MFVDTDLLRCGADFSQSAGETVRNGADKFASTELARGVFGDFDAAHGFQSALSHVRQTYITAMQAHRAELDGLAEKAVVAAASFVKEDEASGSALDSAGRDF